MIFWIASYPKSGNTWLRLLITNYLWPTNNSNQFENLKNIEIFPQKKFFEGIVDEEVLKKDRFEIFKHFVSAQDKINLNDELNILKTHTAAVSIKNDPFTNPNNSCGAVYIVRDPRSVAVSHSYHHRYNFEKSTSNILNDKNLAFVGGLYTEARLSWKVHYISWKKINMPKIIIKYEDLHNDTFNKFLEVLKFINANCNSPVSVYATTKENKISIQCQLHDHNGSLLFDEFMEGEIENNLMLAKQLGRKIIDQVGQEKINELDILHDDFDYTPKG